MDAEPRAGLLSPSSGRSREILGSWRFSKALNFMDDKEYIQMERDFVKDKSLSLKIRRERDRRRHLFMISETRSKLWWEWHNALCEQFGKIYENY